MIAKALDVTPGYLMGWEDEKILFECDIPNVNKHYGNQKRLLKYFDNLNSIGKEEAVKRLEELTQLPKYTENQECTNIEVTDKKHKSDDDIY